MSDDISDAEALAAAEHVLSLPAEEQIPHLIRYAQHLIAERDRLRAAFDGLERLIEVGKEERDRLRAFRIIVEEFVAAVDATLAEGMGPEEEIGREDDAWTSLHRVRQALAQLDARAGSGVDISPSMGGQGEDRWHCRCGMRYSRQLKACPWCGTVRVIVEHDESSAGGALTREGEDRAESVDTPPADGGAGDAIPGAPTMWRGFASTFDLSGETMMGEPLIDVDAALDETSAGGGLTVAAPDERGARAANTGTPTKDSTVKADRSDIAGPPLAAVDRGAGGSRSGAPSDLGDGVEELGDGADGVDDG